ncbi:hypothetical protein Ciccas_003852 [Cichlidogyrus casuarinus]|uniref:Uncharacterized protein n=1 Tax=Cichlidogyrus casuarinus TaxID=1844966 RepID=A0ABD2QE04_9PLAT
MGCQETLLIDDEPILLDCMLDQNVDRSKSPDSGILTEEGLSSSQKKEEQSTEMASFRMSVRHDIKQSLKRSGGCAEFCAETFLEILIPTKEDGMREATSWIEKLKLHVKEQSQFFPSPYPKMAL